jgi:RNA-directed DNA polymerase
MRPLGIRVVRDRVCQQAARLVLEPILEADFLPCSYGSGRRRSATQAKEQIRTAFRRGYVFAVDGDIRDYFSSIGHERLLGMVAERISDRRVLKLLRQCLQAGVMADGRFTEPVSGTPQGGVISPLRSNIYLHAFDRAISEASVGVLVRYADDWTLLCRSEREADAALELARGALACLGLELHLEKTRVVDLREGREGCDFLGCHFRARGSGRMLERGARRYYLQRWPSQRSMKRIRQKIKARTGRGRAGQDIRGVIADLNPILRGWGSYFRSGNASTKFVQIDLYVVGRLRRLMRKRYGRNLRPGQWAIWTREWFEAHGLYRLRGTIRYPGSA